MDEPRVITDLEIFEDLYVPQWKTCMRIAKDHLEEQKGYVPTMSDLLSATAQLFIAWNQNASKVEYEKKRRQTENDVKFGKGAKK